MVDELDAGVMGEQVRYVAVWLGIAAFIAGFWIAIGWVVTR